jgi:alkylation response protein AidB-like acyl-CoA dehydrogenase
VRAFRFNAVITEELMRAGEGAAGLPGIASGELVTAVAMTEPGIGSELVSMTTTAVRGRDDEGDHYLINGSKTFITNGIKAGLVITAVKTDPAQRHRGISLMVLERGMPGFGRGRNRDDRGDESHRHHRERRGELDEPVRHSPSSSRQPMTNRSPSP